MSDKKEIEAALRAVVTAVRWGSKPEREEACAAAEALLGGPVQNPKRAAAPAAADPEG